MKELSIQEKAERYDKAIEIARYYYNDRAMPIGTNFKIEKMFPELGGNENEKIRKDLCTWLEHKRERCTYPTPKAETLSAWIAWLEKQGDQKPSMEGTFVNVDEVREDFMQEVYRVLDADTTNDRANQIIDAFDNLPTIAIQKPANNVEPIFRVGDYIRNKKTGDKVLIVQVDVAEKAYCYVNYDGAAVNHSEFLFVEQDEWELLGYKVTEPKLAEDSVKISESSTEEKDMTEYKKGFECGKQRVLKYPEDFGLCKKPDYKLDPKFKPGDWIITPDKKIKQIEYISFGNYRFTDGSLYNVIDVVNKAHLWTIQDAKAGDVLETTNYVYIFHSIDKETETVSFYCLMKKSDEHFSFGDYKIHDEILNSTPATQEQRDLLFQRMKEKGYEWDSEKKELKKINTYCQKNCKGFQETGRCFADGECKAKKEYIEQKHNEWSEEDEVKRNALIGLVEEIKNQPLKRLEDWDGYISWLKSLKDKVHPKQEWSEEDIRNIENIDSVLFYDKDLPEDTCVRLRNWLKSLKPQNHWKPTEAQLASLTIACDRNDRIGFDLTQLLKELKKL